MHWCVDLRVVDWKGAFRGGEEKCGDGEDRQCINWGIFRLISLRSTTRLI